MAHTTNQTPYLDTHSCAEQTPSATLRVVAARNTNSTPSRKHPSRPLIRSQSKHSTGMAEPSDAQTRPPFRSDTPEAHSRHEWGYFAPDTVDGTWVVVCVWFFCNFDRVLEFLSGNRFLGFLCLTRKIPRVRFRIGHFGRIELFIFIFLIYKICGSSFFLFYYRFIMSMNIFLFWIIKKS